MEYKIKTDIRNAIESVKPNGRNINNYISLTHLFDVVDAIYDKLKDRFKNENGKD